MITGLPPVILGVGMSKLNLCSLPLTGFFVSKLTQASLVRFETKKPDHLSMIRFCFVGVAGFEPTTPWSQTRYTTGLCYTPNKFPFGRAANVITFMIIRASHQKVFPLFCDSAGSRTRNPQLRRLMLYPVELPNPNYAAALMPSLVSFGRPFI